MEADKHIKLNWEKNSRVVNLCKVGYIEPQEIIDRTQTQFFPEDEATVRMKDVASSSPWITIHIRGKSKRQITSWGSTQPFSKTARVQFGRDFEGYALSGELDDEFDFEQVNDVVNRVKRALGL
tara:strand:+ start:105 stop:476 length:372 start_codon:yes stop_codon:yes gene_type:complete